MNKVLVVSGYHDYEPDYSYKKVFDMTLKSKIDYCDKHNYDFLAIRRFPCGIKDIGKMRLIYCLDLAQRWETVLWIDADSIITNSSISVEQMGLGDCCFYASPDYGQWALSGGYVNTGNFIIKNTSRLKEFYYTFINIINSFDNEQSMINHILKTPIGSSFIQILENKYLGSQPKWANDMRTILYNVPVDNPRSWVNSDFIAHLAGLPNDVRIEVLNKHFSSYLGVGV
jgi:hypothetical protein